MLRRRKRRLTAFEEPGGDRLREWIDACPNQEYSALTFMGGAVWRQRLMDDLGDQGDVSALIERRSDEELAALQPLLTEGEAEIINEACKPYVVRALPKW